MASRLWLCPWCNWRRPAALSASTSARSTGRASRPCLRLCEDDAVRLTHCACRTMYHHNEVLKFCQLVFIAAVCWQRLRQTTRSPPELRAPQPARTQSPPTETKPHNPPTPKPNPNSFHLFSIHLIICRILQLFLNVQLQIQSKI